VLQINYVLDQKYVCAKLDIRKINWECVSLSVHWIVARMKNAKLRRNAIAGWVILRIILKPVSQYVQTVAPIIVSAANQKSVHAMKAIK